MEFKNVEKFESWIKATVKNYRGNINPYLHEVETQYHETASHSYELSSSETKSGNPESYYFDVEIVEVEEDDFVIKITF